MKKEDYINNYNRDFKKKSKHISCLCGTSNTKRLRYYDRYGLISPSVICLKCGLIYTNPRPSEQLIRNFYETGLYRLFYESVNADDDLSNKLNLEDLSKKYEFEFQNSKFIYNRTKKILLQSDKILEVGMGGGWNLLNFKNKKRLYGIELDKSLCQLAIKKGIKKTLIGNFNQIKNFKTKFKLIIMNHVIEHIFNLKKDLNLIHNFLIKDGYLYVGCPLYDHSHNYGEFQNVHNFYFTKNTLIHYLSKLNFDLVEWGKEDNINQYALFKSNSNSKIYNYNQSLEIQKVLKKHKEFKYAQKIKYKNREFIKNILGKDLSKIIKKYLIFYRKYKRNFEIKIFGENKIRKNKSKYKS